MTLAVVILLAFVDIAAIKAEPDLNKRSELALSIADQKIDEARGAYQAGNEALQKAAITEVGESVELCYAALKESQEQPRKSRYYKRAELRLNALIRRLGAFRDDVDFDFRPNVDAVIKRLSDIHDNLLSDIMSKKK